MCDSQGWREGDSREGGPGATDEPPQASGQTSGAWGPRRRLFLLLARRRPSSPSFPPLPSPALGGPSSLPLHCMLPTPSAFRAAGGLAESAQHFCLNRCFYTSVRPEGCTRFTLSLRAAVPRPGVFPCLPASHRVPSPQAAGPPPSQGGTAPRSE